MKRGAILLALVIGALSLTVPGPRAHVVHAASCSISDPTANYGDNGSWGTDADIEANFHIGRSGDGCPDLVLPTGSNGYDTWTAQQQMLWLFNQEREIRGFGDLTLDSALMSHIATNHSLEMAHYGYFAHQSPFNYPQATAPTSSNAFTTVQQRLTSNPAMSSWACWGEDTFAGGSGTAAQAVYDYMYEDASSAWDHRHNILGIACGSSGGNFNYAGIGVVNVAGSPYQYYFTDDFLQLGSYATPSATETLGPAMSAPTYSGTTATVTNVADAPPSGSGANGVTNVVFYVSTISASSNGYGDWYNVVPATSQGGGAWTATISSLNGGSLHAVAVDGSGNYTDCAAGSGACGPPRLVVSAPSAATPATAASVTVTAENADGSTMTGYAGTVHFLSSDGAASLPPDYTFGPEDNGTHTFTVTLNSSGQQTISASDTGGNVASGSSTVSVLPGPPVNVTAFPGGHSGTMTVSWAAPGSYASSATSPYVNAPVTSYTVTCSPSCTPVTFTPSGSTLVTTLSDFTNGTSYQFAVAATSALGTGPTSALSNAATPSSHSQGSAAVPSAPAGVSATPGNSSATVNWTAPNNNESAITSYTVSVNGTCGSGSCASVQVWGGQTTAVVSGLTNGNSYTFTVTATNYVGTGAASSASSAVTPAGPPDAPIAVTATAGDASASIRWSAPNNEGGSITGYTVACTPACPSASGLTTTGATSTTVTGLTDGTSYTFTVAATNSVGTGASSAPSNSVVPARVPDAPSSVTASAGDGTATVSWSAPYDGGSTITLYAVSCSPACPSATGLTTTGSTTMTIGGLTDGTVYSFTVTATNAMGASASSAASNVVEPSAPPVGFDVSTVAGPVAAGSTLSVTVTAVTSTGGVATSYSGTVALSSTDPSLQVGSYSFQPSELGTHTFSVTLWAPGSQAITAADVAEPALAGTSVPLAVALPISAGWNLISLPGTLAEGNTAVGLTSDLDSSLGPAAVAAVATFANGAFAMYVPGFSSDVPLTQSQGAFILNSTGATSWTPSSSPFMSSQTVALVPGWNLVAAPFPYSGLTPSAVAAEVSGCSVQELALLTVGTYRTWTPTSVSSTLTSIPSASGMWILCSSAGSWTPT